MFVEKCPPESIIRTYDSDSFVLQFCQKFGEEQPLSWDVGVLVPESFGGGGADVREVAIVMEEIGRAVTLVP
ncbi:acyl-CoA dehydrogenase family protein [Mycobacterium leprae]|uniref:acyl-CoA dehydrogenase family protein n=1 Tax=Mycobacterium leprae TaxID=1769 RepID=UPI000A4D922C